MAYLILFVEGIITFISPCLLPMLPIYISYFAGGGQHRLSKTFITALGFVLGFTAVFVTLGALAGTIGSVLRQYQTIVNLVSGLVVIFFGLSFMGIFELSFFRGVRSQVDRQELGFFSAVVFGGVFSVGWTPCVGTFLGSALMLASQQGHTLKGMGMLLCYSLGLGVPFLLSALFINRLKNAFDLIKRNYRIINLTCGVLLVLVGILMATGTMGRLLAALS